MRQIHSALTSYIKSCDEPSSDPNYVINLSSCQYPEIGLIASRLFGWSVSYQKGLKDWDILWTDAPQSREILSSIQAHQKINHFPGMQLLGRKNLLARGIARLKKCCSDDWEFVPETWMLPFQTLQMLKEADSLKNKTFIVKPQASCQGRGIYLSRGLSNIQTDGNAVVQQYIQNPLLLGGLKFDLRIYVLVSSCIPLRLHIFQEGLGRFSTEPYKKPARDNLQNQFMHLTNYAINKHSSKFISSHKKTLASVFKELEQQGYNTKIIWRNIKTMVVKTLLWVQPQVAQEYRACQPVGLSTDQCFQLLGFDFLLDKMGDPHLLEVNLMPSFRVESEVDAMVKGPLIAEVLKIVGIGSNMKRKRQIFKKKSLQRRVLTGIKHKMTDEERGRFKQRLEDEMIKRQSKAALFQLIFPTNELQLAQDYQRISQYCYRENTNRLGTNVVRSQKRALDIPKMQESLTNNLKLNTKEILERIYKVRPKRDWKSRMTTTQSRNKSRPRQDPLNRSKTRPNMQ